MKRSGVRDLFHPSGPGVNSNEEVLTTYIYIYIYRERERGEGETETDRQIKIIVQCLECEGRISTIWIGLVSLFNGTSNFEGYSMQYIYIYIYIYLFIYTIPTWLRSSLPRFHLNGSLRSHSPNMILKSRFGEIEVDLILAISELFS